MGTWKVDSEKKPGVISLQLEGNFSVAEMEKFILAHNRAIDDCKGKDYKIFLDIRAMQPLNADAATAFERAKVYSSGRKNFRGSAVWVASAVVAMQHRRTSISGGVMDTELISENEAQLLDHLDKVSRS